MKLRKVARNGYFHWQCLMTVFFFIENKLFYLSDINLPEEECSLELMICCQVTADKDLRKIQSRQKGN